MVWFNVDDGAHSHPKVIAAGNAAFGLFCRLGAYSSHYATQGRVPTVIVHAYGSKGERDRLMATGMLHRDGDEYVMHDYLDYNRSAEQIARDRERANERKRRQRDRERDSHGVTSGVTADVSHVPQAKPSQANTSITSPDAAAASPAAAAVDKSIQVILDTRLRRESASIRDPRRWRASVEHALRTTHAAELEALAQQWSEPDVIAAAYLGLDVDAVKPPAEPIPWCGPDCECDGTGFVDGVGGAAPCPNRSAP